MKPKPTPGLGQGSQTISERNGLLIDVLAFSQWGRGVIDDAITVRVETIVFFSLVKDLVWIWGVMEGKEGDCTNLRCCIGLE